MMKKVISAFVIHRTVIVSDYVHMYKCVHVLINTLPQRLLQAFDYLDRTTIVNRLSFALPLTRLGID